jgi:hypothetical protein
MSIVLCQLKEWNDKRNKGVESINSELYNICLIQVQLPVLVIHIAREGSIKRNLEKVPSEGKNKLILDFQISI